MLMWKPEMKNFCQGVTSSNNELSEVKYDATEGIMSIVGFISYKIKVL